MAALAATRAVPDVILVDAAHDHPLGCSPFALASPDTVVVLSASGPAITAAYALIKRVSQSYGRRHFRVLVNKVRSAEEAQRVYSNLAKVAAQRGIATLGFAGYVPLDDAMSHSSRCLRPVVTAYPDAMSSLAFRGLAADMLYWPADEEPWGLEQFMRQLIHLSQRITPNVIHAG
jgi:flagellar biosynthesis protein FlhG